MKIIKIIVLNLLALFLIACTCLFILFQTFDPDQYLSKFSNKISYVLTRPVSIGHMGLGLSSQGITLDLGPVIVADNPDFTLQPFIQIDKIRISLDLKTLIVNRKIQITNIILMSPEIHFIRNQDGQFNIYSILQSTHVSQEIPVISGDVDIKINKQKTGILIDSKIVNPAFGQMIKSIEIQNAAVSFIDQNKEFPLDIWLKDINVHIDDFSILKPFSLNLEASLYSNKPNTYLLTKMSLDVPGRSVKMSDLKLNMNLSRMNIDDIKGISPEMSNSPFLNSISGAMQLSLDHLNLDTTSGVIAEGDLNLSGVCIKNFNIIKTLLNRTLGVFAGIIGNIDNLFNGQVKEKLDANDTNIEKAQVQFSTHDKNFFVDDSLIQTDIFELKAKGTIDQGLNTDMQTTLHLNQDVSAALISELGGLSHLMDDSNRIVIGASLKGVIPHLEYKPNKDFRKKSKKMLMEEGGNILGILLGGGQK